MMYSNASVFFSVLPAHTHTDTKLGSLTKHGEIVAFFCFVYFLDKNPIDPFGLLQGKRMQQVPVGKGGGAGIMGNERHSVAPFRLTQTCSAVKNHDPRSTGSDNKMKFQDPRSIRSHGKITQSRSRIPRIPRQTNPQNPGSRSTWQNKKKQDPGYP